MLATIIQLCDATSVNQPAQLASYKVADQIAESKKAPTIAEELMLPAALDMVSVTLDDASAAKIKTAPLSKDPVTTGRNDSADDLKEELLGKLKTNGWPLMKRLTATKLSAHC